MDYFNDPLFLRQIIMDHYENPRHQELKENGAVKSYHMKSDTCIDDLTFHMIFEDDRLIDIAFEGHACTIATSSASIMTELTIGKTRQEIETLLAEFNKMLELEPYDEELLEQANAFKNVGRQANRKLCANLSWRAIEKALKEVKADEH